jgi:hypothetical protein
MKRFFVNSYNLIRLLFKLIGCVLGKHDWEYVCGNFHSRKDVFKCKNCKKQIEE